MDQEPEPVSVEQRGLLLALEKMKIETPEQLEEQLHQKVKEEKTVLGKYPRISLFYGEPNKGEVNYRTWRYEVNCLLKNKEYSGEALLLGVRRSLRGEAAAIAMRLGETATIENILVAFHSVFGNVETKQSLIKKFHGCTQQKGEPVVKYVSRLEELFSQCVEMGALSRTTDLLILKCVFYEGLSADLKLAAMYKFDTIGDYNEFKAEIRKIECELSSTSATCNVVTKEQTSEMSEMKKLLQQISARIDKLEKKEKNEGNITEGSNMQQQMGNGKGDSNDKIGGAQGYSGDWSRPQVSFSGRGPRHYRGSLSRGQHAGSSSRGSFRPSRQASFNTFRPDQSRMQCYKCGGYGHVAKSCATSVPAGLGNIQCYKCSKYGHRAANCPLNG